MKEGSKHFNTFTNKVFGGWDMCIEEEAAARLQTRRIVKEIEVPAISKNYSYFVQRDVKFSLEI